MWGVRARWRGIDGEREERGEGCEGEGERDVRRGVCGENGWGMEGSGDG